MKNQFTSFENDYRNEVFNQSLDLDADFLSDLEKRLEEPKRKKKGLLFWWIFGASTLCTVVVYGMLQFRLGRNESWYKASNQTQKKQGRRLHEFPTVKVKQPRRQKHKRLNPFFQCPPCLACRMCMRIIIWNPQYFLIIRYRFILGILKILLRIRPE